MTLAAPFALWWALAALPIIALYVLKVRLRRETVSTTIFWQQVFEQKQPRSVWQRFRHLISLLVQLALVALLVAALTQPLFDWELNAARHVVFVVDNSASMNATDVAPSRLAAARDEAADLISRLRYHDEAAIVTCGGPPRVLCGLTAHRRTLNSALDRVLPTENPTSLAEAVTQARRILADSQNRRIIVLTDGCAPDAAEVLLTDDVEATRFGNPVDNVAITRFQARRSLIDPVGYDLLVEVANHAETPSDFRLELELDNRLIDVVPLELSPRESIRRVFANTSADGGRLVASIDVDDALAVDNRAYAILPSRAVQEVLIIGPASLFVDNAFVALPQVRVSRADELPESLPTDTVLVLIGDVPQTIPPGNVFIVNPQNESELWALGSQLTNPIVASTDDQSPLLAHVRLDNVLMPEARQLRFSGAHRVLASSLEDAPLLTEIARPEGRVVVLSVNLEKGDLPLRTAFPILVTNLLSYFNEARGDFRESRMTGQIAEVRIPAIAGDESPQDETTGSDDEAAIRATQWKLAAPNGTTQTIAANGSTARIGPLHQTGFWTLQPSSQSGGTSGTIDIAVNLANSSESDLISRTRDQSPRSPSLAAIGAEPFWFLLVAAAWLLATVEWFLYQRRWIS